LTTDAPLIIVGAPRCGTNMLRNALLRVPGVVSWPCDEIDPIWRHGNLDHPNDELPPEFARPEVRRFIAGRFERILRGRRGRIVVEKTCANSLRIPFVSRILPEARYLLIHRDPFDAVASAMRRWNAPIEWRYLTRKARFVPWQDLPRHASRFLCNRLRRAPGSSPARWWGPRFAGMERIGPNLPLDAICAMQWRRCVERAVEDLRGIPGERVRSIAYEAFVGDPTAHLSSLAEWLRLEAPPERIAAAAADVSTDRVGHGRERLGVDACARVDEIVGVLRAREFCHA